MSRTVEVNHAPSSATCFEKERTDSDESFQGFDVQEDTEMRRLARMPWADIGDNTPTNASFTTFESDSEDEAEAEPATRDTAPATGGDVPARLVRDRAFMDPVPAHNAPFQNLRPSAPSFLPTQPPARSYLEQQRKGALAFRPEFGRYHRFTTAHEEHHASAPRAGPARGSQIQLPSEELSRLAVEQQPTTPPPQQQQQQQQEAPAIPVPRSRLPAAARPKDWGPHELVGSVPFFRFDDLANYGQLPRAQDLAANPCRHPKLFLGHVWSRVPTGVVQWLINTFCSHQQTHPPLAFEPQVHFGQDGSFRGCLHFFLMAHEDRQVQSLIHALHKRILFDREGVWYAEDSNQMKMLDAYCRRIRALPQNVRYAKLQGLPCNPMTCELARKN